MATPDPAALRNLAVSVAGVAAGLVRSRAGAADLRVEAKTSATDPVTEVDRAVEAQIVGALLAVRPDDGMAGEEGADRAGTSGVRWLIDPIDGTVNFLYGQPGCNVSVAAEVDGRVVAGAVVDALAGEVFAAAEGLGATRDGTPIRCTTADRLGSALVATGFSYDSARRRAQAEVLTHVLPEVRDIRRVGAAALDLCWVGCGRVDAYYERGLKPWDWAAGALVAVEAGAVVGDLEQGRDLDRFTLAAAPELFGPLRDLLVSAGAGAA